MSSAGAGVGWSTVCYQVQSQHSVHQEILERFVLPSTDKIHGDADFLFQDLAPALRTKTTTNYFDDCVITVLEWPTDSPDLKPTEEQGGIVRRRRGESSATPQ